MDVMQDVRGYYAEQDKDAFADYTFDLSQVLQPGDSVASASWAAPAGITATPGANTATSISVWVQGGSVKTWYPITATYQTQQGKADQLTFRLFIKEDAESVDPSGTALFPNRFTAIDKMRRDRLLLLARSALPSIEISDEYIWEKMRAAEARVAHELRVPLGPTRFFATDPTQEQIDALGGMPWALDPPYDWLPEEFLGDKWGYIVLRNKPIIDVIGIRVAYPSAAVTVLDIPPDWIRMDKKYGHLNLVPSSPLAMQTFGATLMPMISGGRRLPFSVHISYTAGLTNVERDYPDLIDAVFKLTAISIVEDSYLPQSGSISADGLSQSMSVDASKYHDAVDRILHGSSGNGGLMAKIHGIRMMVM